MSALRAAAQTMTHDLRAGRTALVAVCAAGAVVALVTCGSLVLVAQAYGLEPPTLADFLAWPLFGMEQPGPGGVMSAEVMPRIPFGWIVVVMLPCVLVALAPSGRDDAAAALVAAGNRRGAWLGRCGAALACCLAYWAVVLVVCVAAALLLGIKTSFSASPWLPAVANLTYEAVADPPYDVVPAVASAVAVSCAVALAQLALGEALSPRAAFLAATTALAGALFVMTPALPGNLMMMARSTVFLVSHEVATDAGTLLPGLSPGLGFAVSCALALASVAGGVLVAEKRDYLGGVRR